VPRLKEPRTCPGSRSGCCQPALTRQGTTGTAQSFYGSGRYEEAPISLLLDCHCFPQDCNGWSSARIQPLQLSTRGWSGPRSWRRMPRRKLRASTGKQGPPRSSRQCSGTCQPESIPIRRRFHVLLGDVYRQRKDLEEQGRNTERRWLSTRKIRAPYSVCLLTLAGQSPDLDEGIACDPIRVNKASRRIQSSTQLWGKILPFSTIWPAQNHI